MVIETEVEVDIGADDVADALGGIFERRSLLSALNDVAMFLKGISDQSIEELPPATRRSIAAFLTEHGDRFSLFSLKPNGEQTQLK